MRIAVFVLRVGIGARAARAERRSYDRAEDGMVKLLLVDACGKDGSAALADTNLPEVFVGRSMLEGRAASERLIPEVRRMLGEAGWLPGDLDVVGVVAGPGSFTGVRIGLAAAKGLCEATGARMVAVSRLAVLAHKGGGVHALLDAGRGEFFYGRYAAGEGAVEALLSREEVLAVVEEGSVVVCEEGVEGAFVESGRVVVSGIDAVDALPLVLERVERGEFNDVATVDANYLRRTELEVLERLRLRAFGRS